jgi:hypothetical protein
MSHFAKVCDGKVLKVIVAEKEFFDTFVDDSPGDWIQTSYNTRGNKHYDPATGELSADQSKALRGNYASIGYIYDRTNDVFYPPSFYPSWVLNKTTWTWDPPIPMPTDGKGPYTWVEDLQSWVKVDLTAA